MAGAALGKRERPGFWDDCRKARAMSTADSAKDRLVLVTGGTGFVGSHLVERLVGLGYRVRCLVRPSAGVRGWLSPEAQQRIVVGRIWLSRRNSGYNVAVGAAKTLRRVLQVRAVILKYKLGDVE
jgi:NAD(P)-dependent dehydrogenase (short-subunit alcohol dehydrogenase family)